MKKVFYLLSVALLLSACVGGGGGGGGSSNNNNSRNVVPTQCNSGDGCKYIGKGGWDSIKPATVSFNFSGDAEFLDQNGNRFKVSNLDGNGNPTIEQMQPLSIDPTIAGQYDFINTPYVEVLDVNDVSHMWLLGTPKNHNSTYAIIDNNQATNHWNVISNNQWKYVPNLDFVPIFYGATDESQVIISNTYYTGNNQGVNPDGSYKDLEFYNAKLESVPAPYVIKYSDITDYINLTRVETYKNKVVKDRWSSFTTYDLHCDSGVQCYQNFPITMPDNAKLKELPGVFGIGEDGYIYCDPDITKDSKNNHLNFKKQLQLGDGNLGASIFYNDGDILDQQVQRYALRKSDGSLLFLNATLTDNGNIQDLKIKALS